MRKIALLLLSFFLFTAISIAQQKKYISYEVQKGETLKSIAKNYNLSSKNLRNLNPGVSRKPAMGTIIIVPNKNYGKAVTIVEPAATKKYLVKAKETEFGISKKFGVTVDELRDANPTLKDGLKIGMELEIPKPTIAQAKDSINFVLHTVIKDDTVYNLTKRYEVTENELILLNPHLTEGLKLGMLLKIKPINPIDSEEKVSDEIPIALFEENLDLNKEINVAIILPYQLNKLNDSIINQSFKKSNSILNIATDFHLGAKMAIDSLKQKGLLINVEYFDSENSNQKLQRIVNSNQNFSSTNIIIGPLFFDKAHWVAKRTNSIVVAPFYSKKQEDLNTDNLIKSTPSKKVLQQKMLSHLESNYNGENILVINDGKAKTQTQLWQVVNKIKTFDSIQNITVIKPKNGYIDRKEFNKNLDSLSSNWVLLISDENVTTSTTVNSLKGFAERIDINLFALNKGKNFNNVDNTFLGKLKFTYPTSEFLNTENEFVANFYNAFHLKNHAFPSYYAIRGFDVTYDALVRLASEEEMSDNVLKSGQSSRISSIFDYHKNSFGSFENNGLILLQYNEDLTTQIFE